MTAVPPPITRPVPLSCKQFVLALLLTVVLGDVFVRCFHTTWERYAPDEYTSRVQRCATQPRDLVFVGGSTVAEGIDPALVGRIPWGNGTLVNNFNIGLSGATTTDVYFGTRHACPTAPRVLLYGITASDLNDSRHEPHAAQVLLNWTDIRDWQQRRPDTAWWATRQYAKGRLRESWAAYQHRYALRLWAAHQVGRVWPSLCPETTAEAVTQLNRTAALQSSSGYAPTPWFANRQYDHMKSSGWEQPHFHYLDGYRLGSHLRYLEALFAWAEAHDTTVILVDMPITADLEQRHAAAFAQYRAALAEVQARHGCVVFQASRAAVGLNDAHFADLIHLNRGGCERLSHWLARELTQLGEPVRRGSTP